MGKNITVIPANRIRNDNMKQWYDGYSFKREKHIYCPNAVVEAITNEEFNNYWTKTETYGY